MAQMIECLYSKCEALSSNLSNIKKIIILKRKHYDTEHCLTMLVISFPILMASLSFLSPRNSLWENTESQKRYSL
jgi:hypothetical protein